MLFKNLRLNWMPLSIKMSLGKMPVTIKYVCQTKV